MGKRIVIMLAALVVTVALAQYDDAGVTRETDEFEGTTTCSQGVSHTRHPDYLTLYVSDLPDAGFVLYFMRFGLDIDDTVYNMFGAMRDDEILFRFPNEEVVRFDVEHAESDTDSNFDYTEMAAIRVDEEFLSRLITVEGDVRFRLSGADGANHDDTLPADFLNKFSEFLEECL